MDVVIRPVNDRFLADVVFPAFETGVADAVPALERLLEQTDDDRTELLLESLLSKGVEGSFFTLDASTWLEAAYRLLFSEWSPSNRNGAWTLSSDYNAFAGKLDEALHLSLMLEDPKYPYFDHERSRLGREVFFEHPHSGLPISSLISGFWDPMPSFPPDQALTTQGRDTRYDPRAGVAVADWAWRRSPDVARVAAQLPQRCSSLLKREADRLRPIDIPEQDVIYDFWMGRHPEPPLLTVAFSGLGSRSSHWVREIGGMVSVVRGAAELEQGLTSILAPPGKQKSYGDY
jgi:hypothetical protein